MKRISLGLALAIFSLGASSIAWANDFKLEENAWWGGGRHGPGRPGPGYPGGGYPPPPPPGPGYPSPGYPGGGYPPPPPAQVRVFCASNDYRTAFCGVNAPIRFVQIIDQRSMAECILGRTWGYDNRAIWVSRGCRAEFIVQIGY